MRLAAGALPPYSTRTHLPVHIRNNTQGPSATLPPRPHDRNVASTHAMSVTAAENIRYGRPDASEEEVEAVARAANAHNFIAALPEQYDTKAS